MIHERFPCPVSHTSDCSVGVLLRFLYMDWLNDPDDPFPRYLSSLLFVPISES